MKKVYCSDCKWLHMHKKNAPRCYTKEDTSDCINPLYIRYEDGVLKIIISIQDLNGNNDCLGWEKKNVES